MSFLLGVPGRLKTLIDRLTSTRAGYLDNLASYTPARGTKLDNLDALITSRASGADYTPTRAGKLDNLDATVASRAPASTALSTSTWTSARAAKLDNCDVAISSVTPIASIQTGALVDPSPLSGATIDYETRYVNVPISAVADISKCDVQVVGYCSSSTEGNIQAAGRLTSTTNLRIGVAGSTGATYGTMRARWRVIEYK